MSVIGGTFQIGFVFASSTVLRGSVVATALHVIRLRVEKTPNMEGSCPYIE
jgi:hypothetical protein